MMARSDRERGRALGGFTLIELLISLVIGLLVTTVALNFAISVFRSTEGDKEREEVYRNSRFIGMSLGRDIQVTGVGIESEAEFGTLATRGDTIVILHVPWIPTLAPAYEIVTPLLSTNPLPPGGTCGPRCIDLHKDAGGNYDLAPGDLARLQVNTERHLILIETVADNGGDFRITFGAQTQILGFDAGLSGGLLLDNTTTLVQKLEPIVYFEADSILYRGDAFDSVGAIQSAPIAYGVHSWDADLIFLDGDIAANADFGDADNTNDFDDILGVQIQALLGTNRPIRTATGTAFTRSYQWRLTPRNLMYERNR